jgi:hypothetical protein
MITPAPILLVLSIYSDSLLTNAARPIMLMDGKSSRGVSSMRHIRFASVLVLLAATLLGLAQDEGKKKPGLKPGSPLPAPFECYNVNGPAKGRPHCFVCSFGLNPAVLILAREPKKENGEAFADILKKLDEIVPEFANRSLSVGVVIISPDARDSTNNPQPATVGELTKDADKEEAQKRIDDQAKKLIDEAVKRAELYKRVAKRAEGLNHVLVGCAPEMPKGYEINAKAEITVIFYDRMKVIATYVYEPEGFTAEDGKKIVSRVRAELSEKKK